MHPLTYRHRRALPRKSNPCYSECTDGPGYPLSHTHILLADIYATRQVKTHAHVRSKQAQCRMHSNIHTPIMITVVKTESALLTDIYYICYIVCVCVCMSLNKKGEARRRCCCTRPGRRPLYHHHHAAAVAATDPKILTQSHFSLRLSIVYLSTSSSTPSLTLTHFPTYLIPLLFHSQFPLSLSHFLLLCPIHPLLIVTATFENKSLSAATLFQPNNVGLTLAGAVNEKCQRNFELY